jgi:hypothetical protein
MPIPTDKPLKNCRFCNKSFVNLGLHIINAHPNIMEQLDEDFSKSPPNSSSSAPQSGVKPTNTVFEGSFSDMLRRKAEDMLNIRIMQMLEKGATIEEVTRAITPPQNNQLKDIIELHNAIYKNTETSGPDWMGLAEAALPVISQILPKKQEEIKNDTEHRQLEKRSAGIRRLVPQEITGNTGKSGSPSGQSGTTNGAEQQDSSVNTATNKGAE